MKKIINQAPIVRYRASVSEIVFPEFWNGTFSAESDCYVRPRSLELLGSRQLKGHRHFPFPFRFPFVGLLFSQRGFPGYGFCGAKHLVLVAILGSFRLCQISKFARPAGKSEVRPGLHLGIVVVFSIPLGNFTGRSKPHFAMALRVPNELAEQNRSERPAANKRVIAPHHEFGVALAFLIEAVKSIFPHLEEIPWSPRGALIARIIIDVLIVR